jgi:hypothetical protein
MLLYDNIKTGVVKKFKILLGVLISDIGGIVLNTFPMILMLYVTRFYAAGTPHFSLLVIASVLLISLTLFIIPFQLISIIIQLLSTNLNICGIFSFAIIRGIAGGSLFYLLVITRFDLYFSNVLYYILLGIIQSIIAQFIYLCVPGDWKVRAYD